MLDAGLRVGECVKLLFSDCFFNSVPVTSIVIRSDISKTGKERILPVNSRLQEALKNYRTYFTIIDYENRLNLLFKLRTTKGPISIRQVERIFFAAGKAALGRVITPHMLRHTFATRLMRVTDIRTVQELLGHTSLSSTQIYTHPNGDDLRKAVDAI